MSRGRGAGVRTHPADSKYRDHLVGKFVNILMTRGKKSTAQRVCYGAFDVIHGKTGGDPLKVFHSALGNVKPMVEGQVKTGRWCVIPGARRNSTSQTGGLGLSMA